MSENELKTVKPKPAKDTEQEFFNASAQPDVLEMAEAIGRGMAESLKKDANKVQYTNASTVALEAERQVNDLAAKQRKFAERIANEIDKYVDVTIPLLYKQYCPSMVVQINGCTIKLEAGKHYRIHPEYANEVYKRLAYIDKQVESMRSGGSVQEISQIG